MGIIAALFLKSMKKFTIILAIIYALCTMVRSSGVHKKKDPLTCMASLSQTELKKAAKIIATNVKGVGSTCMKNAGKSGKKLCDYVTKTAKAVENIYMTKNAKWN